MKGGVLSVYETLLDMRDDAEHRALYSKLYAPATHDCNKANLNAFRELNDIEIMIVANKKLLAILDK